MAHSHEHNTQKSYGKAFAIGIGLNIAFVAVEIFYGLVANSSALLADAGHNASDVLSLIFAWAACQKNNSKYTYDSHTVTSQLFFY